MVEQSAEGNPEVEQDDTLDVDHEAVQDDNGLDINLDGLELEGYLDRAARVEVRAMEKEAEREAAQERHHQAEQIATKLDCTHREGLIIHDARQQHEHAEMDLISARRLFEAAKQAWNHYYKTTSNHTAAQDAAGCNRGGRQRKAALPRRAGGLPMQATGCGRPAS